MSAAHWLSPFLSCAQETLRELAVLSEAVLNQFVSGPSLQPASPLGLSPAGSPVGTPRRPSFTPRRKSSEGEGEALLVSLEG